MRLIDADTLSELLVKTYEKAPTENALLFVALLLKNSEQVPTVALKQGEWIEGWDGYFETLDCSLCGFVRNERHLKLNYCPNCGAAMTHQEVQE